MSAGEHMPLVDGVNAPEFLLNGRAVSIAGVSTQSTLLDFLRGRGLTGAKEGCAEGECGACTVVMTVEAGGSSEYRTLNSCLMLAPMAAGHEIYTVESLAANGKLCEAQAAMAAGGASQCGYCTPGFVMSLFTEQYRRGRQGACDCRELTGNLCRCTGYRPIRDAALALGPAPQGPFLDRLDRPAPRIGSVDYRSGNSRFSRPASVEECVAILREDTTSRLIAGGTDLVVDSNLRGLRWEHLVSTESIEELRQFEETAEMIRIGAGVSLTEIARRWTQPPACVTEWLARFASPPIRNRATLGGNLATASPIGDGAPLLLAFDATVEIAGTNGRRKIPLHSFFKDYRQTSLGPGEILTAIEIPKPLPTIMRFYKIAKRRMDDISTVAAAIAIDLDDAARVTHVRLAFGGVATTPIRAAAAEHALLGEHWNRSSIESAASALARELHPISDHRGSAAYRRAVAASLLEKFWCECKEEAA
jgi:xanthine dehydrogenase small subunit